MALSQGCQILALPSCPHVILAGLKELCSSAQVLVWDAPGLLFRKVRGPLKQEGCWCKDWIVFNVIERASVHLGFHFEKYVNQFIPEQRTSPDDLVHSFLNYSDEPFKLPAPPRGMTKVEFPLDIVRFQVAL